MIRKGKQAKIIYAKRGEVISPIAACTKTVQNAVVIPVELKGQKQAEILSVLPESTRFKEALSGKTVSCSADKPNIKTVTCKDVKKDITIKTLFSDEG